jgi:hypothetical protein
MPKGVYDRSKAQKKQSKATPVAEAKAPARRGRPPKKLEAQETESAMKSVGPSQDACIGMMHGIDLFTVTHYAQMRHMFVGPDGNKEIVAKLDRIVSDMLDSMDPAAVEKREEKMVKALKEYTKKAKEPEEEKQECAPVPAVAPAPVPMPAPVPFAQVPVTPNNGAQ